MTIAHEIGHTIIDRDLPVQSGRLRFKTNAFHFVQPHVREQLCDLIASELLLPTPLFFAAVETAPGSSDVVSDIAKEFGIPETTIMMRMNCHSGMSSRWRLC